MQSCYHCQSNNLLEMCDDVVCKDCGTMQEVNNFVAPINYIEDNCMFWSNNLNKYGGKYLRTLLPFKENVQDRLNMVEYQMEDAIELFMSIYKEQMIKKESRRLELFVACCIKIIQKQRGCKVSDELLLSRVYDFGVTNITWAQAMVNKNTSGIDEHVPKSFSQLVQSTSLNQFVKNISTKFKLAPDATIKVRSILFKLVDQIGSIPNIKLKPDKLVGSLIYMAMIFARVPNIKLHLVAKCCETSETTILKGEHYLKDLLLALKGRSK